MPISDMGQFMDVVDPINGKQNIQKHINQIEQGIAKEKEIENVLKTTYDILSVFDPSGISSYPELFNEIKTSLNDGEITSKEALSMAICFVSALPMIGKVTLPFKSVKMAEKILKTNSKLFNKVNRYIEQGNKIIDTLPELAGIHLPTATIQDITSKFFVNPQFNLFSKGIHSLKNQTRLAYGLNTMVNATNTLNNGFDIYQAIQSFKNINFESLLK